MTRTKHRPDSTNSARANESVDVDIKQELELEMVQLTHRGKVHFPRTVHLSLTAPPPGRSLHHQRARPSSPGGRCNSQMAHKRRAPRTPSPLPPLPLQEKPEADADGMAPNTSAHPRPDPLTNSRGKTHRGSSNSGGGSGRASMSSDPNRVADVFGFLSLDPGHFDKRGRRYSHDPQQQLASGRPRRTSAPSVGGSSADPSYVPHSHVMQVDPPSAAAHRPLVAPYALANSAPSITSQEPARCPGNLPTAPAILIPMPALRTSCTRQYVTDGSAPLGTPLTSPPLPQQGNRLKPQNQLYPDLDYVTSVPSLNNHLQDSPVTPQRRPALPQAPNTAPVKPGSSAPNARPALSALQTPYKRPRAASSPPPALASSSGVSRKGNGKGGPRVRCSGITKAGKRCTRLVPMFVLPERLDGDEHEVLPHYCNQHLKAAFMEKRFYSHKDPSLEVYYDGERLPWIIVPP